METRKEFIKKTLRIAAFSAIASSTGYLLFSGKISSGCDNDFACSGCSKNGCKIRLEDFVENETVRTDHQYE